MYICLLFIFSKQSVSSTSAVSVLFFSACQEQRRKIKYRQRERRRRKMSCLKDGRQTTLFVEFKEPIVSRAQEARREADYEGF